MKIGIDFDNTIICYDKVFKKLSSEQKLFPRNLKKKQKIKQYIIKMYSEKFWTFLQSLIYGEEIESAEPFPSVKKTLLNLKKKHDLYLVSHKSKFPYLGKRINLIEKSIIWLKKNKFIGCKNYIFMSKNIFFEKSIKSKVDRITKIKCDIFIDDLKILLDFLPLKVFKIHFGTNLQNKKKHIRKLYDSFSHWDQLENKIKKYEKLIHEKSNFL